MNCPLLEELTFDHPHLGGCDACATLFSMRDGSRPDPAACDEVSTLLPLYSDSILGADDQALVDDHLSRCPACTRAIFGDAESTPVLSEAWSTPKGLDELAKRRSRIPIAVSLLVAAAALLVLFRWQPWQENQPGLVGIEDIAPRETVDPPPTIVDAGPPDAPVLPMQPDSEHISIVLAGAQSELEACMNASRTRRRPAGDNFLRILPNGTLESERWQPAKPSAAFQTCVTEARATLRFEPSQKGVRLKCTFAYLRSQANHSCEELPWGPDNGPE